MAMHSACSARTAGEKERAGEVGGARVSPARLNWRLLLADGKAVEMEKNCMPPASSALSYPARLSIIGCG